MNNVDVSLPTAAPATPLSASTRRALRWIAWSMPALPVAVLVHELGHFLFYWLFGFPNVTLHFAAVSHDLHQGFWELIRAGDFAAAAQIAPFWQVGIATGSAILISYTTIAVCAYLTATRSPHPFIVAVGLISLLRFQIGINILLTQLFAEKRFYSGTDEGLLAAVTGIPEWLLWVVGLSFAAAGGYVMIRTVLRGRRWRDLALVAVGAVLGAVLYIGVLGPWLLPY